MILANLGLLDRVVATSQSGRTAGKPSFMTSAAAQLHQPPPGDCLGTYTLLSYKAPSSDCHTRPRSLPGGSCARLFAARQRRCLDVEAPRLIALLC